MDGVPLSPVFEEMLELAVSAVKNVIMGRGVSFQD